MRGEIPGLLTLEVSLNFRDRSPADLGLYSELKDRGVLENAHRLRVRMKQFVAALCRSAGCWIYELVEGRRSASALGLFGLIGWLSWLSLESIQPTENVAQLLTQQLELGLRHPLDHGLIDLGTELVAQLRDFPALLRKGYRNRTIIIGGALAFDEPSALQLQDLVRDCRLWQHHAVHQITHARLPAL